MQVLIEGSAAYTTEAMKPLAGMANSGLEISDRHSPLLIRRFCLWHVSPQCLVIARKSGPLSFRGERWPDISPVGIYLIDQRDLLRHLELDQRPYLSFHLNIAGNFC